MDPVGTLEEAQLILDWVEDGGEGIYNRPEVVEANHAPEGWKYLGSGSFRSVWRSPSGVAYKVMHGQGYGSNGNQEEYENLREAWKKAHELPCGVRLPKGFLYSPGDKTVMAMEVVKGKTLGDYYGHGRDEFYTLLGICGDKLRLWDMHGDNAMVSEDDHRLVLVDLGS